MDFVEFQWLFEESSKKKAYQNLLHCSGQLLKRHFSSKELDRPIRPKDISKLPLDLVNHLKINPEYKGPKVSFLEEKEDFLTLHKPGGIHCHPLCYSDQNTLLNFLTQEKRWDLLRVNADQYDRGLLYRLDFETSGIIVMAKNEMFLKEMRTDFKSSIKRKIYWAIVEGDFNQEGEWTHFFRSSGIKGSKQKVSKDTHPEATSATLEVKKIFYKNGKSLLLINLKTGLRHQIRAQLSYLGFPLLGDELYGGLKVDRLFLHAFRYEWSEIVEDPNAELFDRFFDMNSALKMSHDMLGIFKSR